MPSYAIIEKNQAGFGQMNINSEMNMNMNVNMNNDYDKYWIIFYNNYIHNFFIWSLNYFVKIIR